MIDKICIKMEAVTKILLILLLSSLSIISALQVFLRYVLNESLTWSFEFVNYEFVWLVCLGMGLVFGQNKHICVDFFCKLFQKMAFLL